MNAAKSDRELIDRLNNEDSTAFDQLSFCYHNRLYRFAFSMLKIEEDAWEVVQEFFSGYGKTVLKFD